MIFRTLGESLGKANASIAAAKVGTDSLGSVLDRVDSVIGAVEAGAPGTAFSGQLDSLERDTAKIVAAAGFGGTNLLKEGETLTVTLGFDANGGKFDFRQLNFEAVGLSPTEAATKTETVSQTITEVVSTPITREERLTARIEKLVERQVRLENREERISSRLEKLTAREERLTSRLERLDRIEERITDRLVDSGARPTDAKDQKELAKALDTRSKAKELAAKGNTKAAQKAFDRAEKEAQKAGLTISLDKLERLEKRLDRVEVREQRITSRLERIQERETFLTERLELVQERQEVIGERIEKITERLETLTEEQLNAVVGYTTETLERVVDVEVVSEEAKLKSGGFTDLLEKVGIALAQGDTETAKALTNEARARIDRVNTQLDNFSATLARRGNFFDDLTERLDSSIRTKIDENLDDDSAARAAALALSRIEKINRVFSGEEARPGILELFNGKKSAPVQEPVATEAEEADDE
ncbi:hypothetical protein GCM10007148_00640 [Parvularcula lutaonensis]|nr:hypothetical protein GCM10007148_00640 [Parvularcula lutaonensis]